jgi:glucose dehydrogenase
MNARQIAICVLIAGIVTGAWVVSGQQPRRQAQRIDDAALRNAGKTGEEWLSYGLTPGETRYSPLKQIDAANIGGKQAVRFFSETKTVTSRWFDEDSIAGSNMTIQLK